MFRLQYKVSISFRRPPVSGATSAAVIAPKKWYSFEYQFKGAGAGD